MRAEAAQAYARITIWRRIIAGYGIALIAWLILGPLLIPGVAPWIVSVVLAGGWALLIGRKLALLYRNDEVGATETDISEVVIRAVQAVRPRARVVRSSRHGCVIRPSADTRHRLVFKWKTDPNRAMEVTGRSEPPSLGELSDKLVRARVDEWFEITQALDAAFLRTGEVNGHQHADTQR